MHTTIEKLAEARVTADTSKLDARVQSGKAPAAQQLANGSTERLLRTLCRRWTNATVQVMLMHLATTKLTLT
jgi:hypothetical protein